GTDDVDALVQRLREKHERANGVPALVERMADADAQWIDEAGRAADARVGAEAQGTGPLRRGRESSVVSELEPQARPLGWKGRVLAPHPGSLHEAPRAAVRVALVTGIVAQPACPPREHVFDPVDRLDTRKLGGDVEPGADDELFRDVELGEDPAHRSGIEI